MRALLIAPVLVLCAAVSAAREVSHFVGPPGGVGSVAVIFEEGDLPPTWPARLQGIELLPIDFVGRTLALELVPGRPRLRTDLPGAGRIQLPGGNGSLYRYRRAWGGKAVYGLMLVGADGLARSLGEFPGSGPRGVEDPFPGPIGIAPDGAALLIATRFEEGGDLIEIQLPGADLINRTATMPARRWVEGSLQLNTSWGSAAADQGLVRFGRDRAAGAATWIEGGAATPLADGTPKVADGLFVLPDGSGWLGVNDTGDSSELVVVRPDAGSVTLLAGVDELPFAEAVGDDHVVLLVQRSEGYRELYALPLAKGELVLVRLPDVHPEIEIFGHAVSPDGTRLIVALRVPNGGEWIARLSPARGRATLLAGFPFEYGNQLAMGESGTLSFSAGLPDSSAIATWAEDRSIGVLPVAPQPGHVLPGL